MTNGYTGVQSRELDARKISTMLNRLNTGKLNATGDVTLTANQTTTNVSDLRCGVDSVITFMPQTANAASAMATTYVSARNKQGFTISHANDANTDKTFSYIIIG